MLYVYNILYSLLEINYYKNTLKFLLLIFYRFINYVKTYEFLV